MQNVMDYDIVMQVLPLPLIVKLKKIKKFSDVLDNEDNLSH